MTVKEKLWQGIVDAIAKYKSPFILTIDPGKTGAVAFRCREGYWVADIPTIDTGRSGSNKNDFDRNKIFSMVLQVMLSDRKGFVGFEEAMISNQNKKFNTPLTAFWTGRGYEMWVSAVEVCVVGGSKIPYQVVRPSDWKKEMKLNADKNQSLVSARRLFPEAPLTTQSSHNRAEALLLSAYFMSRPDSPGYLKGW